MKAYCVKCKAEREMKNPKIIETKNGHRRVAGVCAVCGSKMSKFLPAK